MPYSTSVELIPVQFFSIDWCLRWLQTRIPWQFWSSMFLNHMLALRFELNVIGLVLSGILLLNHALSVPKVLVMPSYSGFHTFFYTSLSIHHTSQVAKFLQVFQWFSLCGHWWGLAASVISTDLERFAMTPQSHWKCYFLDGILFFCIYWYVWEHICIHCE